MTPQYSLGSTEAIGPLIPNTPTEVRAASLTICERATDQDDARGLLTMLGLVER